MSKRASWANVSLLMIVGCASTEPNDAFVSGANESDAPSDAADVAQDEDVPPALSCVPWPVAGEELTHVLGGWTLEVSPGGAWRLVAGSAGGGEALATLEARPGLALGRGEPSVETSFGAFRIALDASAMAWWQVDASREVCLGEGGATLAWGVAPEDGGLVALSPAGERGVKVQVEANADAGALAFACSAESSFFGLGTQATGMDLRGRRFPLWTQEQGIGKPEAGGVFPINNAPEAAYAPMGAWHSSEGWSALVTSDGFGEVEFCENGQDIVIRSYPDLPGVVFLAEEHPKEQVESLTAWTGRLSTWPEPWWFGPWNDAVGGPARLRGVAELLRARGIPSSAIWTEDWIGGEEGPLGFMLSYAWEWSQDTYPALDADIAWLHEHGFAFLAYFNTFVPDTTRMWEEGLAGDYLVRLEDGSVYEFFDPGFRNSGLVDLRNSAARAWLGGYMAKAAVELGVDGWMADFAEWLPVDAHMADGTSGWFAHNSYPVDWQALNREVLEQAHASEAGRGWVYFSRSGWASANGGSPSHVAILWAGDQETSWHLDDGLPTVVPIGAHAGLGGVALYGSDIAGYSSYGTPPATKELFFRWASLGALSPVMRTHHGSSECANWSFDRDEDTLVHFARWARVHALLIPYLWQLIPDAMSRGLPLFRHPWLEVPERPELWKGSQYRYFLGPDLYVAPVLASGVTSLDVPLPGEGWWPLFGDAPVAQDAHEAPVAVTELPVYVRPGTALPLLLAPMDTFYGVAGGHGDALALGQKAGGGLRLALYPDEDGRVHATVLGALQVSGAGFTPGALAAPWTLDGNVLPACSGEAPAPPCVDGDGVAWVDGGSGTLQRAGAILSMVFDAAEAPPTLAIGIGRAAWGELAEPTVVEDLAADVPLPCEK